MAFHLSKWIGVYTVFLEMLTAWGCELDGSKLISANENQDELREQFWRN